MTIQEIRKHLAEAKAEARHLRQVAYEARCSACTEDEVDEAIGAEIDADVAEAEVEKWQRLLDKAE